MVELEENKVGSTTKELYEKFVFLEVKNGREPHSLSSFRNYLSDLDRLGLIMKIKDGRGDRWILNPKHDEAVVKNALRKRLKVLGIEDNI